MGNMAVHLAVAGDVFDGDILCCLFSHESVPENFPTYFSRSNGSTVGKILNLTKEHDSSIFFCKVPQKLIR